MQISIKLQKIITIFRFCFGRAKWVNRGVKMPIRWMNSSKPLEILDIFGELWMGIWRKWVKIVAAPHGIKI